MLRIWIPLVCVSLLTAILLLRPVLGFDFAQQIKMIAFRIHLKRKENENENENAQSLLISHIFKFIESNQGSPVPSGNAIKVLRMLLWLLSGMAQIFTMPVERPASSRDNENIDVCLRVAIKINVNTNRFLCFLSPNSMASLTTPSSCWCSSILATRFGRRSSK